MAKIQLINIKGEKLKDLTLDDNVWNIEANDIVLKKAVDFIENPIVFSKNVGIGGRGVL